MPNGTYGGVRGRKTKVGIKLLRFPPTRLPALTSLLGRTGHTPLRFYILVLLRLNFTNGRSIYSMPDEVYIQWRMKYIFNGG